MIIDTDVLIWYMRGNPKAYRVIQKQRHGFSLSVVTYMELVQGVRNKRELDELQKALKRWNATILPITEIISEKAKFYIEQYYLSHSLQLADALIAGTAVLHALPILTGNDKHYNMVPEIQIRKFRP
jgi:predicted nucleic acid-binding protein